VIAPDARGPAPLTGLIAVVVLIAVVAGGVVLTELGRDPTRGTGGDRDGAPAATPAGRPAAGGALTESERVLAGTRALIDLEHAVRTEREDEFARVFAEDPGAAGPGADIFTSLRRLPLSTYSMRYIGEVSHRADTWRADVAVQWGLQRVDRRAVTSEIQVTFTGDGDERARVTAMSAARDEQAPAWLLGRLQVERVGPALVLSLQPPLTDGVVDQTRRAVADVRAVLRGWGGGLVVVLPGTTAQLEQLLAAEPGSYDSIAAVTASADGTSDPTAPVRVVLNPPVFGGLGPIAGQVVLSHEATHAATGATFRDMPLWLVEGFGDYVALAGEPVPLEVAAGQALERVRRSGAPEALPDEGDFSAEAHGLGSSYEAAWLACRLIAEEYGQDALLRFYQAVSRDGDVDAAFEKTLGTTEDEFTADWRDYLRELAG
jgi:hypothetical protein